jgi:hypothetical protein
MLTLTFKYFPALFLKHSQCSFLPQVGDQAWNACRTTDRIIILCVGRYIYIYICVCVYTYIYIFVHIYTYLYIYIKDQFHTLWTDSKNKNIGDLHQFEKCVRHRTNFVRDMTGFLLANFHHILIEWKNHFCQLLNVRGVNIVGRFNPGNACCISV